MTEQLTMLSITAASIGFFHTIFGPDHYLPFIVLSKANKWSFIKTIWVTILCGIGHVASSVVLGIAGILFGVALARLQFLEGFRGNIAAWLLILFGLIYGLWGVRQGIKAKPHTHAHLHEDGSQHEHTHVHLHQHAHVHSGKKKMTPWILFTIFVLGPCEPLIPILMYPAAKHDVTGAIIVASIFSIITIATMTGVVTAAYFGLQFLPMQKMERFVHAIAGGIIFLSGLAIQFLGL